MASWNNMLKSGAWSRFWRDVRGGVMLEFAFAMPILVGLLMGGVEFARFALVNQKMERVTSFVGDFVARAEALDEVRVKLNGLKEAYDVNGAALHKSHDSVKLSLAVSALQSRVSNGEPFHEELDAVVAVVGSNAAMGVDDPGRALVHAVVGSIPESVARSGVPTAGSLRERLSDVRRAARRLSLVPETGGGIVTYLVAYLASWLRMSESTSMSVTSSVTSSGGGVEAAVASARANVAAGSLAAAAAALEEGTEGTAAGQAVAGWVADARERQRLEMAVSVLRSHAAAAAASLA